MSRAERRGGPRQALRDALEAFYRAAASFDRKVSNVPPQRVRVLAQELGEVFYLHPQSPLPPEASALHLAVLRALGKQYPRLGRIEMWLLEGDRTLAYACADGRPVPASGASSSAA